jgi:hypothetical protein
MSRRHPKKKHLGKVVRELLRAEAMPDTLGAAAVENSKTAVKP